MRVAAGPRPFRSRALAGGCAAVVGLVAVSGCSEVHLSRPGRTAACAQALPAAFSTVHSRGRLIGFRVVRHRSDLRMLFVALGGGPVGREPGVPSRHQPRRYRPSPPPTRPSPPPTPPRGTASPRPAPVPPARAVCVAVFQGSYGARDAAGAPPGDRGRYAVLIIFIRHAAVVRTRLVDVLPRPVRRLL